jgi:rubrerythrin
MSLHWRRLAIRIALPFSWQLFPRRRGEVLQRFSVAEADSAWHFLDALSHVDQAAIRARLFNNALEEVHHAALFAEAAQYQAQALVHLPVEERVAIYDPQKGLQHFYAFVYVGEKDVYDQFDAYAAAIGAQSVKSIFSHLKEDEDGHMQFAKQRLAALGTKQGVVLRQVRSIRRRRVLESWVRGWRRVSDLATTLLLSALYFFFGVFARASCRRAQESAESAESNGARNKALQ